MHSRRFLNKIAIWKQIHRHGNVQLNTINRNYAVRPSYPLINTRKYFPKACPAKWCGAGAGIVNYATTQNPKIVNERPEREERKEREILPTIMKLLDKLESQKMVMGTLNGEQFKQLLDHLEAQENSDNASVLQLTREQTYFLLEACGTLLPAMPAKERQKLCNRILDYLRQRKQQTVRHYSLFLQVLQTNRQSLEDFRNFLDEFRMIDDKVEHTDIYSDLLAVACAAGEIEQVAEILSEMRHRELPLTERNFNALILGNGRAGDLDAVKSVLENMSSAGVTKTLDTQTALMCAYLENNDFESASELLKQYHGQFSAQQIVSILQTTLVSDISDELLEQLVKELPVDYASGLEVPLPLKNLCIELLHTGKLDTAVTIVKMLPIPKFPENQSVDTYCSFLIRELFRADTPIEKIIEICQMLNASGRNTRALHIATEYALRRDPPSAIQFFIALSNIEKLRPHYFWPLLLDNFHNNGEQGLLETLKTMKELNVEVDRETLSNFVLSRLSLMLEDPVNVVKQLEEVGGIKPSISMGPILSHLMRQLKIDEVTALLELYPTKLDINYLLSSLNYLTVNVRVTKRYHQFAKMLSLLAKRQEDSKNDFIGQLLMEMLAQQPRLMNDLGPFIRFLNAMQKIGLKISPAAMENIKNTFQTMTDGKADLSTINKILQRMSTREVQLSNSANAIAEENGGVGGGSSFIKHPRDMTLDELECHLIELEAKNLNTRGVLRRLLQLCVREGRLVRAQEIKAKCDALRVQTSPGMLASVFDMYIKLQDLPNAQKSLQQLHTAHPGFQVDEHKMIDYAALLVQNGQLEAGKKLLQERAARHKIIGGNYVVKNVWNFLNSIAKHAANDPTLPTTQNLTREAFHALQLLGYCRPHNAVLGPIVREYLLRGELHAALNEFRELAERYRHTPLQLELLSLLVRLSNSNSPDAATYNVTPEEAQRLLNDITNVVQKVHGAENMNSGLLIAFAECGTDNQLRRLLMNPEFRINHAALVKNCEHLNNTGAVETLLRLARGARGLNHTIDEQEIHELLLKRFADNNDYEGALKLFEKLEADDEFKISEKFSKRLVNLLKINNLEIPSEIALSAKMI